MNLLFPNKSKIYLGLCILLLFFLFSILNSLSVEYLNHLASEEAFQVLDSEKYKEINKTFKDIGPIEGNDLGMIHIKYLSLRIFISSLIVITTNLQPPLGDTCYHLVFT